MMPERVEAIDRESPAEKALDAGRPQRVGWFRFHFDDEHWEWSAEVQQMHGYEPGSVVNPTTRLVLSHKHPDDYQQVAAMLDDIRRTRSAFSARHRIIDTTGNEHHVVVVSDQLRDDAGIVIGTYGFYVDVTATHDDRESEILAAVAEFAKNRAVIDQAMGVLMVVYGIDADTAFDLLKWRSQETKVKIRALAQQLMSDFQALRRGENLPARSTFDQALLTTQNRIADDRRN